MGADNLLFAFPRAVQNAQFGALPPTPQSPASFLCSLQRLALATLGDTQREPAKGCGVEWARCEKHNGSDPQVRCAQRPTGRLPDGVLKMVSRIRVPSVPPSALAAVLPALPRSPAV